METTSNPTVSLFGIDFDLTILAMSLLTVIIVFGVVFWSSRDMTIKPKENKMYSSSSMNL